MGSQRAGRGLKRFLEAVGFILAKFEPKRSHEDPIRDQNYGFGTYDMCWNVEIYGNIYIMYFIYGIYIYIYGLYICDIDYMCDIYIYIWNMYICDI